MLSVRKKARARWTTGRWKTRETPRESQNPCRQHETREEDDTSLSCVVLLCCFVFENPLD